MCPECGKNHRTFPDACYGRVFSYYNYLSGIRVLEKREPSGYAKAKQALKAMEKYAKSFKVR